jgi:protein-disulfide isomerase
VSELGSAPVPGLQADDHVRGGRDEGSRVSGDALPVRGGALPVSGGARPVSGGALLLIEYADFECPYCAALDARLAGLPVRRVFRHFPVRSSHPRAWPAACAAEAAGLQGRFWEMHDSLYGDQARLEDPHLWDRAGALGLDVDRFDLDRRGDGVLARVKRDFHAGVRAGVVTTPTVFVDGVGYVGDAVVGLLERLAEG